jgi:hypothetical protein
MASGGHADTEREGASTQQHYRYPTRNNIPDHTANNYEFYRKCNLILSYYQF